MNNENKKPDPSKDVHLQALKIFINLSPQGTPGNVNHISIIIDCFCL